MCQLKKSMKIGGKCKRCLSYDRRTGSFLVKLRCERNSHGWHIFHSTRGIRPENGERERLYVSSWNMQSFCGKFAVCRSNDFVGSCWKRTEKGNSKANGMQDIPFEIPRNSSSIDTLRYHRCLSNEKIWKIYSNFYILLNTVNR